MEVKPQGRSRKFTDDALRTAIQAGITPTEFARQVGVSRQAVNLRVKQLELTTASVLTAPEESRRFIRGNLGVMEQLAKNLINANRLQDACDEWLRDPNDPTRYELGPRGEETIVTWIDRSGEKPQKRKDTLAALLERVEGRFEVESVESKHADPRELILKTQNESRQHAALIADLIQKLTNARIMEDFRLACIEEIGKESPDCARRIADRLQSILVLHAAFAGPGAISGGGGEAN